MNLNSRGISLIEITVALSLFGFFSLFIQQAFLQTDKYYLQATIRSDIDRAKQLENSALRNNEKVKAALQFSLNFNMYDELLNCFGQKGLSQVTKQPGTNCNTKFPAPANAWLKLQEPPGSQIYNKLWSPLKNCDANPIECLFETQTQFIALCTGIKCDGLNLKQVTKPTLTMIQQKDKLIKQGFSVDDFKNRELQIAVPLTTFGIANQITNEICGPTSHFMNVLDFDYQALLCNDRFEEISTCDRSLRSINGTFSCDLSTIFYHDTKTDGQVNPAIIDLSQDNSKLVIAFTAKPSATDGVRKIPDPTQKPSGMRLELIPFVDISKGDTVRIDCPLPLASSIVTGPAYVMNVPFNSLKNLIAGTSITCTFYVATSSGSSKGNIGQATLGFSDSAKGIKAPGQPGYVPVGGSTTSGPPSVDSSRL